MPANGRWDLIQRLKGKFSFTLQGDLTDVQMTMYEIARFEVLRAVLMDMQIFRDVTPCRLVNIY
jgi:hypothetical protein